MSDIVKLTYCSFCGRHSEEKEVHTMVVAYAGCTTYAICDSCVTLCSELIASRKQPAIESGKP